MKARVDFLADYCYAASESNKKTLREKLKHYIYGLEDSAERRNKERCWETARVYSLVADDLRRILRSCKKKGYKL